MTSFEVRSGWTRHGWPIPYTVQDPAVRPRVHRCGGPPMCDQCREDVAARVVSLGLSNVIPSGTLADLNEAVADHITRSIRELARQAQVDGVAPDWRFFKFEVVEEPAGLIGRWSVPAQKEEQNHG